MNVLVDTSVWVAHFKRRDERLVALLHAGMVVCHPYVIVEIACGTPPDRRNILTMLADLEQATLATHDEVLELIERQSLSGKGCGLVDLSLLASTLLNAQTRLMTLDARLLQLATQLGRAYDPKIH